MKHDAEERRWNFDKIKEHQKLEMRCDTENQKIQIVQKYWSGTSANRSNYRYQTRFVVHIEYHKQKR